MNKFSDIMDAFAKAICLHLDDPYRTGSEEPVTVDSDLIKKIRNYTGDNGGCHFDSGGHEYLVKSTKLEPFCNHSIKADCIRVLTVDWSYVSVAAAYCYHDRGGVWMANVE